MNKHNFNSECIIKELELSLHPKLSSEIQLSTDAQRASFGINLPSLYWALCGLGQERITSAFSYRS